MAKKVQKNKPDINLSDIAGDAGLTVLQDSTYAVIYDRLPLFLPRIDVAFGGGLPFGRMIEIAGKPGGGKSTISFHAARVGTALGCLVVLIDVEGTADRDRLSELGIDTSKVMVKQPDPKKGIKLTVEEVGRTIEQSMKVFSEVYPGVPVIFIWDSVGQTPSQVEFDKEYGEMNVGARAKAITQFVTKVAPLISEHKAMLIGINQVRDTIGGNPMFPTYSVPGGNAWEHYASLRIEIQKKAAIKKGTEKIGHVMGVHTRKSKVSRPFQIADGFLISDTGIDYEYNIAEMAKDANILKSVGASFEFEDKHGVVHKKKRENFVEWMRTPEGQPVREELMNALTVLEFPNGQPALKNANISLDGWLDQLAPFNPSTAPSSSSEDEDEEDPLVASLGAEMDDK